MAMKGSPTSSCLHVLAFSFALDLMENQNYYLLHHVSNIKVRAEMSDWQRGKSENT